MSEFLLEEFDEVERYELSESLPYRFRPNRRQVVQMLGAGLVISVTARVSVGQQRRGREAPRAEKVSERFHIAKDGTVTVMTSKVEVGQGSRTQLTQAAAEELHVPMAQIQLVMADTELCPDDGGTAGSRTTPSTVPRVRNAAAAARELLIDLAAKKLAVDRSHVSLQDGQFVVRDAAERLSLDELASDSEFATSLSREPQQGQNVDVVSVDEWRVLGKPAAKVNGDAVVTGKALYPSDITRPGMLYGKVLRPPTLGSTLKSIEVGTAQTIEGVTVVQDESFVGCVAGSSWRAKKAIEVLAGSAQWETPPQPSSDELFSILKTTAQESGGRRVGRGGGGPWGEPQAAFEKAAKKLEADYTVAYIQHAPMEPRAAVAEWTDGKLTVWTGSQQPSRVRDQLAETFRINRDHVRVIVPDTGGGFGGKHSGEAAVEAARLAQAAKKPVSLRWTREEEFTWAYFRPAGLIEVRAGLDDASRLLVWEFTNYNSGGSALETPYQSPHGQTQFKGSNAPLRQGSYRALASTANTFAREGAINELAELAGADPLDFRLSHLPEGRLKDVLQAVAKRFDWRGKRAARGNGRGVGIACGTEKASFVASCADVEVTGNEIKVLSVCTAYECGAIQNPANLRNQVAGAIVMGLGGALFEEIRFKDGRILNGRFSEYQVPRMEDLPELDIELVDRKDLASVGAGETPIIAVAPAIAAAVHQATSKRLRSLPMKLG